MMVMFQCLDALACPSQTGKMITIPITAGIVGEVVRTKTLRNVADTSKDRRELA